MKLKPREVYLRAAEEIASGRCEFSCNAISAGFEHWPESCLYHCVMAAEGTIFLCVSDITGAMSAPSTHQRCRNFRVLLLCMMAAAYKDIKNIRKS